MDSQGTTSSRFPSASQSRVQRMQVSTKFMGSPLGKLIRNALERRIQARGKLSTLRVESLVDGSVSVDKALRIVEGAVMVGIDPRIDSMLQSTDPNALMLPTMDEYYDSAILRVNALQMLPYFWAADIENDLSAFLLFFDPMTPVQGITALAASLKELMPGTRVVQAPLADNNSLEDGEFDDEMSDDTEEEPTDGEDSEDTEEPVDGEETPDGSEMSNDDEESGDEEDSFEFDSEQGGDDSEFDDEESDDTDVEGDTGFDAEDSDVGDEDPEFDTDSEDDEQEEPEDPEEEIEQTFDVDDPTANPWVILCTLDTVALDNPEDQPEDNSQDKAGFVGGKPDLGNSPEPVSNTAGASPPQFGKDSGQDAEQGDGGEKSDNPFAKGQSQNGDPSASGDSGDDSGDDPSAFGSDDPTADGENPEDPTATGEDPAAFGAEQPDTMDAPDTDSTPGSGDVPGAGEPPGSGEPPGPSTGDDGEQPDDEKDDDEKEDEEEDEQPSTKKLSSLLSGKNYDAVVKRMLGD